jgi:hypothetical protein
VPKSYPLGVAKLLPEGTVLNLDMHYNPKGRATRDPGTAVALQFTNEPVRQIAITAQSGSNAIDIPPGEAHWELTGKPFVFEEDSHILSFTPRMNERGKRRSPPRRAAASRPSRVGQLGLDSQNLSFERP